MKANNNVRSQITALPAAFQDYLDAEPKTHCQEQTVRKYPDGRFTHTDWRDVTIPSYKSDLEPQMLTDEDVRLGMFPTPVMSWVMSDGVRYESRKIRSEIYGDIRVDFCDIVQIAGGKATPRFTWSDELILAYRPKENNRRRETANV